MLQEEVVNVIDATRTIFGVFEGTFEFMECEWAIFGVAVHVILWKRVEWVKEVSVPFNVFFSEVFMMWIVSWIICW